MQMRPDTLRAGDANRRSKGSVGAKNQKVVHPIRFHKIILSQQTIPSFSSLFNNNVTPYAVILAVTVAVDNSNSRAGFECGAQVS